MGEGRSQPASPRPGPRPPPGSRDGGHSDTGLPGCRGRMGSTCQALTRRVPTTSASSKGLTGGRGGGTECLEAFTGMAWGPARRPAVHSKVAPWEGLAGGVGWGGRSGSDLCHPGGQESGNRTRIWEAGGRAAGGSEGRAEGHNHVGISGGTCGGSGGALLRLSCPPFAPRTPGKLGLVPGPPFPRSQAQVVWVPALHRGRGQGLHGAAQ